MSPIPFAFNKSKNILGLLLLLLIILLPFLLIKFPTKTQKQMNFPFLIPKHCQKLLLYFGYLDCNLECPRAMQILANLNKNNHLSHCVFFVNLYPDQAGSQSYARYFDPSFQGISLNEKEIKAFSEHLNLSLNRNLQGEKESFYFDLIHRKHPDFFYEWGLENGHWQLVQRHAALYLKREALR
jgi:hypothetical protein